MIRLLYERQGWTPDLTPYLDEGSDLTLSSEIEWRRFGRSSSDLSVSLSNHNGFVKTLFAGLNSDMGARLVLYVDGVQRFSGWVSPALTEYDFKQEVYKVVAFDPLRSFLEHMRTVRVARYVHGLASIKPQYKVYISLAEFMERELFDYQHISSKGWFRYVDMGEFATKTLRDAKDSVEYGNEGRWTELDPDVTWDVFLQWLSYWYNASFWIDPQYDILRFTRRRAKTGSSYDLDSVLADESVVQKLLDEDPVDWLKATIPYAGGAPELVSLGEKIHFNQTLLRDMQAHTNCTVAYRITNYVNDEPRYNSPELRFDIPSTGSAYDGYQPLLRFPPGLPGVTSRVVYRLHTDIGPKPVFLGPLFRTVLGGNLTVEAKDTYGPRLVAQTSGYQQQMPDLEDPITSAHVRYDSATEVWQDPVYDITEYTGSIISGVVEDIRPLARFISLNTGTLLPYDPQSVWAFFGRERTVDEVHEQYADLFLPRSMIQLKAHGAYYKVGDEVTVNKIPELAGRKMILKRVETDLRTEISTLDCIL